MEMNKVIQLETSKENLMPYEPESDSLLLEQSAVTDSSHSILN
jgi:hypothetical protein